MDRRFEYNMQGELYHYGVKGMHWYERRYQNEDGTLTEEGKQHYARKTQKLLIKADDEIASMKGQSKLDAENSAYKELGFFGRRALKNAPTDSKRFAKASAYYDKLVKEYTKSNLSDLKGDSYYYNIAKGIVDYLQDQTVTDAFNFLEKGISDKLGNKDQASEDIRKKYYVAGRKYEVPRDLDKDAANNDFDGWSLWDDPSVRKNKKGDKN